MFEQRVVEHPVLVPTSVGLVGGVVTEPTGSPTTAVLLLPGWRDSRSGTNRVWARLARALGDLGAVVLRLDYPGRWDSDPQAEKGLAMSAHSEPAVREAAAWFRERAGDLELMLVGWCLGGRLSMILATDLEEVRAVAYMSPIVATAPNATKRIARSIVRPAQPLIRRVLISVRKYAQMRERMLRPRDPAVPRSMTTAAQRVPVWMLLGDQDEGADELTLLASQQPTSGALSVEVVPGARLSSMTPPAQQEIIDRVVAWARPYVAARADV